MMLHCVLNSSFPDIIDDIHFHLMTRTKRQTTFRGPRVMVRVRVRP